MNSRTWLVIVMVCMLALTTASFGGLVAHYEFSGDFNDTAGSNHGTAYGDASILSDAQMGQVASFDGNGDYVIIQDSTELDGMAEITLAAWVKINSWNPDYSSRIISKNHNPQSSYELAISAFTGYDPDVAAGFYCQNTNNVLHSPSHSVSLNTWYHLAATNSGTQQKLYINGVEMGSDNINTGAINDNNVDLWLGQISDSYVSGWFNGLMDDVRIYDNVLSQQEIAELVPEPTSILILGSGLVWLVRRK